MHWKICPFHDRLQYRFSSDQHTHLSSSVYVSFKEFHVDAFCNANWGQQDASTPKSDPVEIPLELFQSMLGY
eukprot:4055512-Ditylum_brightwellii.AAC.1